MKKIYRGFCLILATLMMISCLPHMLFAVEDYGILSEGLVAHYDAVNNTGSGHDADATVWKDLAGDNDITLEKSSKNYFNDTSYHLNGKRFYFSDKIFSLVNSNEFTLEMKVGKIESTGSSYTTMINSSGNDNFALFLRTSGDYIEFKSAGNSRPKVSGGKNYVENSTLAITFSLKDKLCVLYIDGMEIGSASITQSMGAAGKLFFGHDESSKIHTVEYEGFRFYNRPLTAQEVANNAKADGNYDFSYKPPRSFNKVSQASTNIAGGIALSEAIVSQKQIDELLTRSNKPAISLFYVNKDLDFTDQKGSAFVEDGLQKLEEITKNSVIPAFYVENSETLTALTTYLAEIEYEDCFIVSKDFELISLSRTTYPVARGVLDMTALYEKKTDLSDEDILEIRKTANKNLTKIVILPFSVAKKEDINKLANYGITVWINGEGKIESKTDALYALLSGAHGILSDNIDLLVDMATNILVSNTVTRMPLNIGHRGTSPTVANAPENTVENALISYENGANAIEVDIYITADGHLVINHNSTTTNMKQTSSGKSVSWGIESKTLAQLKTLYYAGYYEKDENGKEKLDENGEKIEYKGFKLSSLEELFTAFKDKDVVLIIEFKSSKTKVVPALKKLIEKHDMYDQCSVICYESYKQHVQMVENFPEMTVGLLWGSISPSPNKVDDSIKQAVLDTQKHNTTLNPNYGGFTAPYVRAATYRGMTVWPYTINNAADIKSNFLYGHAAITTDYSAVIGEFTKTLNLNYTPVVLPGSVVEISAEVTSYKRETTAAKNAKLFILEGEDLIEKTEGLTITPKAGAEGQIVFFVSYEHKLTANNGYTVYTQPQSIVLSKEAPLPTPSEESPSPTESVISPSVDNRVSENTSEDQENVGYNGILGGLASLFADGLMTIAIIAVALVVILAAIIVLLVIMKKKKKS